MHKASLFLIYIFDQGGRGGEDGRECEEQAANSRAKSLGNDACSHGHDASEEKAEGILVRFRRLERGEFYVNHHSRLPEAEMPDAERDSEP